MAACGDLGLSGAEAVASRRAGVLRSWRIVLLVARREITVRVRERSFLISGALSLLLIAGITLGPSLLTPPAGPDMVAATDARGVQVAEAAAAAAPSGEEGIEVRRLSSVAARRALAAEDVDAIVSHDGIAFQDATSDELVARLQEAHRQIAAAAALDDAGLSAAQARAALSPAPLAVDVVEPQDPQADARAGVAFIAVLLLYVQLLTFGFFVASGVVEEKASRVVELLLAAVKPRDLLAGKLLGIGALGLAQLAVIAGVGLAAASATGRLEIDSNVVSAVALAVVWFLLGYAFYSCLFACAGALVPRQEELQAATTPLTLVILVCFFLAFGVLQDPDGTLARVSSFIPPLAPMTLPPRIALGEASAVEVIGGVMVTVGAIAALIPLAARIYSGALLGSRTRVKLRDAWQGTRP